MLICQDLQVHEIDVFGKGLFRGLGNDSILVLFLASFGLTLLGLIGLNHVLFIRIVCEWHDLGQVLI